MKRSLLFAACLTAAIQSYSRNSLGKPVMAEHRIMIDDTIFSAIPPIGEMMAEIVNTIGLQSNFELKAADVQNIEATISRKKRMIYYNPAFIDWINRVTRDKWATMALLAHEIGHHLNGHTVRKTGSEPNLELEADEFAGFVLHKLGASLEEAQEVMIYIANSKGSKTHPARNERMLAIRKGWSRASDPHLASIRPNEPAVILGTQRP